ncbi:efflux RND transporter periplasmic adaptor subunit [Candidatus Electronema sp. JM]|uniref:efflux RND transporter periplasmic adaptor subunit n=1 Tax=Candidatus Electronema sp. JM TaxID=3401571 RepID=UPI003AA85334
MTHHHPEPKTMRGKIVWFFLSSLPGLIVILLMTGAVFLIGQKVSAKKEQIAAELKAAAKTETPPVNVVTLQLQPSVLRDKISLPGAVEAWDSLQLMPKVGGSIEDVLVKEGDSVQKGQLVAKIDAKDYQIALASAQAAYELAKANLARNENLRSKGISTQANLEEQQNQVRQTKAALDDAELKLSRCQITAPMAGLINRLDAKVGLMTGTLMPTALAEIIAIDQVKAVVAVPEADVAAVRKLNKVEVEIQALGSEKMTAPVHYLAAAPSSQARAYRLELRLDNPGHRILPGMFLRANIVKNEQAQALAVPLFSVISRNNEQFVYVEKNGAAQRRNVRTGFLEDWQVLITEGLKAGDKVIIEGHRSVEDGQAVKVVKAVDSLNGLVL